VLRGCERAVKTIDKQMMEGIELETAGVLQNHFETLCATCAANFPAAADC
jgi:hypothetical protein